MLIFMRTTIEITDELLRKAKEKAISEGVPLREVIEMALRSYLARPKKRGDYKLKWRTEKGRILPGVRLDDRDALFDLLNNIR